MTVQHLKDALITEGMMSTGIKEDLVRRLGERGLDEPPHSGQPTTKQLRFILYTWNHRRLSSRTQLGWSNVMTRLTASEWLARWKDA